MECALKTETRTTKQNIDGVSLWLRAIKVINSCLDTDPSHSAIVIDFNKVDMELHPLANVKYLICARHNYENNINGCSSCCFTSVDSHSLFF